jgi:hypothetical protein
MHLSSRERGDLPLSFSPACDRAELRRRAIASRELR